MSKIVQIKIFNDILDQFLEYLDLNFPMFKSDLFLVKNTIDFVRNSNPRLSIDQYMHFVGPYEKYIFNCDEEFFINFDKNLKQLGLTPENVLFGNKIRNIWLSSNINDEQKAHIWFYFQKLLKAGNNVYL
jgi:hypothetical protein